MSLLLLSQSALAAGPPKPQSASTPPPPSAYQLLQNKAKNIHEQNQINGWAYMLSGGIALAAAIPAYYLSEDTFARAIYSISQTVGVAAIGYGYYLVVVENDYRRFARILGGMQGGNQQALTPAQNNRLAELYLRESAAQAQSARKIRVVSHGLTAGLNLLSAFTASQRELRTALFFLCGVNTLAAVGLAFSHSEEEKFLQQIQKAELVAGPAYAGAAVGIRLHF